MTLGTLILWVLGIGYIILSIYGVYISIRDNFGNKNIAHFNAIEIFTLWNMIILIGSFMVWLVRLIINNWNEIIF